MRRNASLFSSTVNLVGYLFTQTMTVGNILYKYNSERSLNTVDTVQLILIMYGVLSMILVWSSALEFSGREHFNESLSLLAARYAKEIYGPISPGDRFKDLAINAVRNSLSPNPLSSLMVESDVSRIWDVQTRAKHARSKAQWEAAYGGVARLAEDSAAIGRPAEAVELLLRPVEQSIEKDYENYMNGDISHSEFFEALRSTTKVRGYRAWAKEVSTLPEDIRPQVWAIGWPETVAFLDHVGRGTAFGLFVGILLNGGSFITGNSISAVAPVIAGFIGGTIHGASVHRRLRTHGSATAGRYSSWARQNPLSEYLGGLILMAALIVGLVFLINVVRVSLA